MATSNKDYGVEFVNIELKYRPELYLRQGEELPNETALFEWVKSMAKDFYRIGFSYNERSSSFTCSCTYKGGLTTATPPCLTQHGGTPLSAILKVYVVMELLGGRMEGFSFARDVLMQLEDRIEVAVAKLL